ncbi:MAG: hypothetical protein LRY57_05130 [Alphaproteobacteria bacterium]|nr:hypothetical protein [Alphaproteobacteria bacterium]
MLSNLEKPSLIVIIRSGGGACCAVHSLNEERLYLMTLQKLEKQLGDKFGTPEYPIPTFNDFIKMAAGWSPGMWAALLRSWVNSPRKRVCCGKG